MWRRSSILLSTLSLCVANALCSPPTSSLASVATHQSLSSVKAMESLKSTSSELMCIWHQRRTNRATTCQNAISSHSQWILSPENYWFTPSSVNGNLPFTMWRSKKNGCEPWMFIFKPYLHNHNYKEPGNCFFVCTTLERPDSTSRSFA